MSKFISPIRSWHRSTYAFFIFAMCGLGFLNVPGQIVTRLDIFHYGKFGPDFIRAEVCEHGWPCTYLWRAGTASAIPPHWRFSLWNLFEKVKQFSAWRFLTDLAFVFAVAWGSAQLFEVWRRRRNRWFQFHLFELLAVMAMVSAAGGYFVFHRAEYLTEESLLQAIDQEENPTVGWGNSASERAERLNGGYSWLRETIGIRPFQSLDRVVGIDATGEDLRYLVKLRHLERVSLRIATASQSQLNLLEDMPCLQAVNLDGLNFHYDGQSTIDGNYRYTKHYLQIPRLPNLRALNLWKAPFRGAGLGNIPAIEVLDLTFTEVDDTSLPALSTLTELKKLYVGGTGISEAGMNQLRLALPHCDIQP
jgi:hypothetical protein